MRTAPLLAVVLLGLLAGGTCIPLVDNVTRDRDPGTVLALVVTLPDADLTVVEGDTVQIEWDGANRTGQAASLVLGVESRDTLARTVLADDLTYDQVGLGGEYSWNTAGFAGTYVVYARVQAGGETAESRAVGKVLVDGPPTFEFVAPTEDVRYESGDTLLISWRGADNDGAVRIGLDPDIEHDTGNEVFLVERDLPATPTVDSLSWTGRDVNNAAVETGTYNLFAVASDGVNPDVVVSAGVKIEVVEPEETGRPKVTEPAEDTDFLDADASVTIVYEVNRGDDALVDIKIDTDDNHANGNEVTILSQQLVEADTDPDPFEWDGTKAAGGNADYGIYRVFIAVSTGAGTPQTAQAEGLIFRRATADVPLVALLAPATVTTVDPGSYVTIRWRDDDPDETAEIRLTVDDDPDPAEAVETGEAELEILTGRSAAGDDAQDTFAWQVPGTLPPGSYYIFAYIDRDGADPADHVSVAPARVIVRDPTQQ